MARSTIRIKYPLFSYDQCFAYLARNQQEPCFLFKGNDIVKVIPGNHGHVMIHLSKAGNDMEITLEGASDDFDLATAFVLELFDLQRDLAPFAAMCSADSLLRPVFQAHQGFRLMRMPNLFELICWAIIGQQINLNFAYKVKRQLVHRYGTRIETPFGVTYLFPTPEALIEADDQELRTLQFSRQKITYVKATAEAMLNGYLDKKQLMALPPKQVQEKLIGIKGVGSWTANYIRLKGLGDADAFPIKDVGLQNALKQLLKLDHKPSLVAIEELGKAWQGWRGYATMYLWQSLL